MDEYSDHYRRFLEGEDDQLELKNRKNRSLFCVKMSLLQNMCRYCKFKRKPEKICYA